MQRRFTLIAAGVLLAISAGCAHNRYGYTKEQWAAMSEADKAAVKSQYERQSGRIAGERQQEQSARDSAFREQMQKDAHDSGVSGPKF